MKSDWKRAFAWIWIVLSLGRALHAEEKCPVEVKLLLSPSTTQTVIASLKFEKETVGQVYLFDTEALDLLTKGVIVRVRQGAANDITVKIRVPEDSQQIYTSQLRAHFPCEIDMTGTGKNTSFSVRRKYKARQIPESGNDILALLNPSQERLLQEARVSIDWTRVRRIADIKSTGWETRVRSPSRKLALELWDWPAGSTLEISTKVGPDAGESTYAELQRLMNTKSLPLSTSQATKTSTVLRTLTHHR